MATAPTGMTLGRQQVKMEKSLPPRLKSIRESEENEVDFRNERAS